MRRLIYYIRVALVSVEALIIVAAVVAYSLYESGIAYVAKSMSVDADLLKYLTLVPAGVAVWVVNEGRRILQDDRQTVKTLTAWPDYWKLKAHVWVSVAYAFLFACTGVAPLVIRERAGSAAGLCLLAASILGQFAVGFSVLNARIIVSEFVVQVKED